MAEAQVNAPNLAVKDNAEVTTPATTSQAGDFAQWLARPAPQGVTASTQAASLTAGLLLPPASSTGDATTLVPTVTPTAVAAALAVAPATAAAALAGEPTTTAAAPTVATAAVVTPSFSIGMLAPVADLGFLKPVGPAQPTAAKPAAVSAPTEPATLPIAPLTNFPPSLGAAFPPSLGAPPVPTMAPVPPATQPSIAAATSPMMDLGFLPPLAPYKPRDEFDSMIKAQDQADPSKLFRDVSDPPSMMGSLSGAEVGRDETNPFLQPGFPSYGYHDQHNGQNFGGPGPSVVSQQPGHQPVTPSHQHWSSTGATTHGSGQPTGFSGQAGGLGSGYGGGYGYAGAGYASGYPAGAPAGAPTGAPTGQFAPAFSQYPAHGSYGYPAGPGYAGPQVPQPGPAGPPQPPPYGAFYPGPVQPAAPPARPAPTGPYVAEQRQLEDMGFTDHARNKTLLIKHKGNVQEVIEDLS